MIPSFLRHRCAALACLFLAPWAAHAAGFCTPLATGLRTPMDVEVTNAGTLIVAETGTTAARHAGRISMLGADGALRTLIDGLPSAPAANGEATGPSGLHLRGRTLFVSIGEGDVAVFGRDAQGQLIPGTTVPNPAGPSSPLFSSVLALHFSAATERGAGGFVLTRAQHDELAAGERVELVNAAGQRLTVERVADFPDSTPVPLPQLATNVALSNPFKLVEKDGKLFVTDGGRNLVWRVDLDSGAVDVAVAFPPIPNPLSGIVPVGGPTLQAVPTGIASLGDELLVTLFRGVPFPPGTSTVQKVWPATGADTRYIGGLKTAIGVLPLPERWGAGTLVLQHASVGPFFGGPGLLLHFATPASAPKLLADCMTRPTGLAQNRHSGKLYATELAGRLIEIVAAP